MSSKGKFIVVDGNEGAGKTTLMQAAREVYGDKLLITREIGGSPYAESIRELMFTNERGEQADAKTFFNLAWAARADHMKNIIKPALDSGMNVLSDRFDSTTWAYQICAQPGGEKLKELFWLESEIILENYKPDLYIFLDVDVEEGVRRKSAEGEILSHFDTASRDFHRKAKSGFLEFLETVPHKVINSNLSKEEVRTEFLQIMREFIGKPE